MLRVKTSDTSFFPSLANTLILKVPALGGVPLNALPSKASHPGNRLPSANVAVKVSSSPSASVKVPAGTANAKACPTVAA